MKYLILFVMVMLQNASFVLVSRSRNGDSILFHGFASLLSNGIWLLVIRKLVVNLDDWAYMSTYVIGSVIGSLVMHWLSMKYIEKWKIFQKKK